MFPKNLTGPGKTVRSSDDGEVAAFLARNENRYPDIHPDFITDVCFEKPGRFDDYFPKFDTKINKVAISRDTSSSDLLAKSRSSLA